MTKTRFHISCCGRSGSKFITTALRSMGYAVIHEMGDDWPIPGNLGISHIAKNPDWFSSYDGIIGWKWSILTPVYAASFPVQMHMVRHPLKAISSATTHAPSLFNMIEDNLGKPDGTEGLTEEADLWLARAVSYWIKYNARFTLDKPVLRVEDFHAKGSSLEMFCDLTNSNPATGELMEFLPKDINSRPKASKRINVTWDLLEDKLPREAKTIRSMASDYGYSDLS